MSPEWLTSEEESQYPFLDRSNYEVRSPKDSDYNCAAWAADDQSCWWWPIAFGDEAFNEYYWPEGARRDETLDAFIDGYSRLGYEVCDSPDLEEDYEKIAVYATPRGVPRHVARQLRSGMWTSKLGVHGNDIWHTTLRDVSMGMMGFYGVPEVYMRRPWPPATVNQPASDSAGATTTSSADAGLALPGG